MVTGDNVDSVSMLTIKRGLENLSWKFLLITVETLLSVNVVEKPLLSFCHWIIYTIMVQNIEERMKELKYCGGLSVIIILKVFRCYAETATGQNMRMVFVLIKEIQLLKKNNNDPSKLSSTEKCCG
jgi:hypothetical protein